MSLLNKLFPPPEPGTARIIPSRHPIQVALLIALIISSGFQLAQGVAVGSIAAALSPGLLFSILAGTIIGCVLCLIAAVIAERHPWDAIGFSMGGFFILSLIFLGTTGLFFGADEWWLRRDFWVNAVVGIGFSVRCIQLLVDAVRIRRHSK